jgi:hypothetical protein
MLPVLDFHIDLVKASFAHAKGLQKAQIWLRFGRKLVRLIERRFARRWQNGPKLANWYNYGLNLASFPVYIYPRSGQTELATQGCPRMRVRTRKAEPDWRHSGTLAAHIKGGNRG